MGIAVDSTPSVSPAAMDKASIRRDILRFVMGGDDPELLGYANDAIRDALNSLNMRNWWWALKTQSITLDNTNTEYDLNSNFKAPIKGELLDSSSDRNGMLNWLDPRRFLDALNDLTSTANGPRYYTVFSPHANGKVTLDRVPSSNFTDNHSTLRLRYYSRLALVSDGDVLDAPSEVESFVTWFGKQSIALSTGDLRKAREAEKMWRRAEQLLREDDEDIQTDYTW